MKIKNKRIKRLIFIIVILIIFVLLIFLHNSNSMRIIKEVSLKQLYGDPIDIKTGIINNEYFNINSTRRECRKYNKRHK